MSQPKRILLGQLASNGDCLYATTIARQIKTDYPNCHLTWAIGASWRSILDGNPDVDEIWEVDYYDAPGDYAKWARFEAEAKARQKRGEWDEIFLTQVTLPNLHLWTGSARQAIFRAYPHPITVDSAPIVRLSPDEVENVRQFAARYRLDGKEPVILFECAPLSAQSLVNPQFAREVAAQIVARHPGAAVILSSNQPFASHSPNIIDGSPLTLRENAELTKYCSLLIGASSGITWISTSDWAKPLPMIQLVMPDLVRANSPTYDFEQRSIDTSRIIEMCSYSVESVARCVDSVISKGFAETKPIFNQTTPLGFFFYRDVLDTLVSRRRIKQLSRFIGLNFKEHGFQIKFTVVLASVLLGHFLLLRHKVFKKI